MPSYAYPLRFTTKQRSSRPYFAGPSFALAMLFTVFHSLAVAIRRDPILSNPLPSHCTSSRYISVANLRMANHCFAFALLRNSTQGPCRALPFGAIPNSAFAVLFQAHPLPTLLVSMQCRWVAMQLESLPMLFYSMLSFAEATLCCSTLMLSYSFHCQCRTAQISSATFPIVSLPLHFFAVRSAAALCLCISPHSHPMPVRFLSAHINAIQSHCHAKHHQAFPMPFHGQAAPIHSPPSPCLAKRLFAILCLSITILRNSIPLLSQAPQVISFASQYAT